MELTSKDKVLVTGAGGFIPSHVVDQLLAKGCKVRGFFNSNGRNDTGLVSEVVRSQIECVFGDLQDPDAVSRAVKGCNIVLHLAASISIPYSYDHPAEVFDVNAKGTLNVLLACQANNVARLVTTSTSEVYGSADIIPITEQNPLKPQSPYAASKVSADAMARSFYTSYGLPVVIARPFNTYGPRQSDRAIIPTIIKQALWSNEIVVGALHPKRDFVFALDSARAFISCAEAPDVANGEVIHFGTNESWSVQETIDIVLDILAISTPVKTSQVRLRPTQSEVLHLKADYSKAQKMIGWSPATSFRAGLVKTIDYIRDRKDQYVPEAYRV